MSRKEAKRKAQDTSFEDQEIKEGRLFQKSKLITRSPPNKSNNEMEKVLEAIQEMRQEMNDRFKESKVLREDLKAELMKTNKQLEQIKTEMKRKQEEWSNEKQELKDTIKSMSVRVDSLEKDKIKNKLVITGLKLDSVNRDKLRDGINNFFKANLGIEGKIKEVRKIGEVKGIVEMENFEEKLLVLKNKHKLRSIGGEAIYISSDMTKKREKCRQI